MKDTGDFMMQSRVNGQELCSVIMPIYNGKKFIEDSVNSIFEQTYHNIEFIAIDDGSSDGTWAVLEELKKNAPSYVTMKIFNQENRGICQTRNEGIEYAHGKYIMFADQDDKMKKDCVERLVDEMRKEDSDIVIGGFQLIDGQGGILEEWRLDPQIEWHKYRITAPWGRLFKKDILDKNSICFMDTKISEDFYFNYLYLSFCEKISVVEYMGYQWLYNEKSESHANMSRFAEDRNPLEMMTQLQKNMKHPNILDDSCVEYLMIKHIIWYLFYIAGSVDRMQMDKIYNECFSWLKEYYPNYMQNNYLHFDTPKGEQLKIRCIVKIGMFLHKLGALKMFLIGYSRLKR